MKSFVYKIQGDRLVPLDSSDKNKIREFILKMNNAGIKTVNVSFEPIVEGNLSTDKQRKLFFKFLDIVSLETGQDKDSLKSLFYDINPFGIKSIKDCRTTKEFTDFIDFCISYVSDFLNINIVFNKNGNIDIC